VKKKIVLLSLALCLCLTGCGNAVLERTYSVTSPHSDSYWENEGTDTLRADSYPDLVSALMLLLGEHAEDATIGHYDEALDATALMEQAAAEVQQETAMGAYLLDYMTYTCSAESGYDSISVQLAYRRTAEEQESIINATSTEALPDLVRMASEQGRERIAVRIGYFATDRAGINEMISDLQQELDPLSLPWAVYFYPDTESVGIVEVILKA